MFKRIFFRITFLLVIITSIPLFVFAQSPKYVFIFIGDGMGAPDIHATNLYLKSIEGDKASLLMTKFPVCSMVTTQCTDKIITDSPAAGTAIANGVKTRLGYLGIDSDKKPLKSFFQVMKEQGKGIALLTTNSPDDATPAAFFTSVPNRGKRYQIGIEMAESNFDFIAGARLRGDKASDRQPKPLYQIFRDNGYAIAEGKEQFETIKNQNKILLLSADSLEDNAIGLMIDHKPNALILSEMTQAAIQHLDKRYHKKGFCMMVEGGDIDHTNHVKDLAGTIHEIVGFDQAIAEAYQFYQKYPKETLILITADHETGGFNLGVDNMKKLVNFAPIQYQKISKIAFGKLLDKRIKNKEKITWPEMKQFLQKNFGLGDQVPLSIDEEGRLMMAFDNSFNKKDNNRTETLYNSFSDFATEVFNILNNKMAVGWATWSHTANQVPFFALGKGAEAFSGYMDNTDIVNILYRMYGMKNPNLSPN